MDWQEYVVWAVGLCVAALLVRRMVCLFRGTRRGGCASCGSTRCPLRSRKRSDRESRNAP